MKQRPILFSTPMVQAILAGRKTMTRRVVKHKIQRECDGDSPSCFSVFDKGGNQFYDEQENQPMTLADGFCPYGQVGDVLWVRETFRRYYYVDENGYTNWDNPIIEFAADNPEMIPMKDGDGFQLHKRDGSERFIPWKPSIHMPKGAARIWLPITNIRVERLHDISERDALAEGIFKPVGSQFFQATNGSGPWGEDPVHAFKNLWESINGTDSWEQNPWVWVITVEKIDNPELLKP